MPYLHLLTMRSKDKLSHSDAMKKIIRGKGDKYDPKLVDVLKSIDKKFAEAYYKENVPKSN